MTIPPSLIAVVRFHAQAGGRVAQRVFLSTLMLVILGIGMAPMPRAVLAGLARSLADWAIRARLLERLARGAPTI